MADEARTLFVSSENGDWIGPLTPKGAEAEVAERVLKSDTNIEVFERYEVNTKVLVEFVGRGKKS